MEGEGMAFLSSIADRILIERKKKNRERFSADLYSMYTVRRLAARSFNLWVGLPTQGVCFAELQYSKSAQGCT